MPKSSKKKVKRSSSKKTHRKTKRSSIPRPIKIKAHTFNGSINGGTLISPAVSSAINTWGGIYTLDMSALPIYITMVECFEFARLNKLTFEFLPRCNVNQMGTASSTSQLMSTIVVGVDELPMSTTSGAASTWSGAVVSEDSGITEAKAQASVFITPDYVRGLENSKEVECYKKITKTLVPAWYVVNSQVPTTFNSSSTSGVTFEPRKRTWFPTSINSSSAATTGSPVFWGCMYAFTNSAASNVIPLYDVRIHYSVSFKRIHGY